MGKRIFLCLVLFSFNAAFLCAQKVLYSPFVATGSDTRFEVIGKAGNYYWIQKSRRKNSTKPAEPWMDDKELRFEVYDARMNFVNAIPFSLSPDMIKEYLVTGNEYFDQLVLQTSHEKIFALLNRYTPDGNLTPHQDTLAEFPHDMKCGDFLLVRSQDKTKMLLLGFETVIDSPVRLHAILFDQDWNRICQTEYSNIHISKPLVQYDLINYPLEDYNSDPIKLANDGEWIMVSSGFSRNYLLFYFNGMDEKFVYKEIKLSSAVAVEDAGLYFDNEKQEGFAGILASARTPAIKNIKMIHYSLNNFRIDFDTSYVLNTLAGKKIKNENIFEEYFMTVPGKGFLLLKEYGRTLSYNEDEELKRHDYSFDEPNDLAAHEAPKVFNKDDYTRYDNLAGTRSNFDKGDLSLYYFPAKNSDSCWSGIINKEQVTELGHSYLSYVFLPKQDKLFFLYNSVYRNSDRYSSSTVLDQKGNPVNEGVEYWQIHDTMVFQKARQISESELAIPYERNARNGFAIIHL